MPKKLSTWFMDAPISSIPFLSFLGRSAVAAVTAMSRTFHSPWPDRLPFFKRLHIINNHIKSNYINNILVPMQLLSIIRKSIIWKSTGKIQKWIMYSIKSCMRKIWSLWFQNLCQVENKVIWHPSVGMHKSDANLKLPKFDALHYISLIYRSVLSIMMVMGT